MRTSATAGWERCSQRVHGVVGVCGARKPSYEPLRAESRADSNRSM
jgi:hypothetical protein